LRSTFGDHEFCVRDAKAGRAGSCLRRLFVSTGTRTASADTGACRRRLSSVSLAIWPFRNSMTSSRRNVKHDLKDFGKAPEMGSNSSIKYDGGTAIVTLSSIKLGRGLSR
jgi:hypothetical protein